MVGPVVQLRATRVWFLSNSEQPIANNEAKKARREGRAKGL